GMAWLDAPSPLIRREAHFGDRVVTCFTERPSGLFAMFAEAVANHPGGEAVVCGEERLSYAALDARVATLATA
ncbi:hypothetical protein, partial [Klebsiella aerogenes]|uniref:hypothetical protein n=1 Tax=Klebsiella aerogenes TaxID=548 RepID=UPI001952F19F